MSVVWLLFGLLNVAFGLVALVRPEVVEGMTGLEATSAAALGELRAVFGALVAALGGLLIASARAPRDGRGAVIRLSVGWIFAALGAGRLVSLLLDGWTGYNATALALEGGAGLLLLWSSSGSLRAGTPSGSTPSGSSPSGSVVG